MGGRVARNRDHTELGLGALRGPRAGASHPAVQAANRLPPAHRLVICILSNGCEIYEQGHEAMHDEEQKRPQRVNGPPSEMWAAKRQPMHCSDRRNLGTRIPMCEEATAIRVKYLPGGLALQLLTPAPRAGLITPDSCPSILPIAPP